MDDLAYLKFLHLPLPQLLPLPCPKPSPSEALTPPPPCPPLSSPPTFPHPTPLSPFPCLPPLPPLPDRRPTAHIPPSPRIQPPPHLPTALAPPPARTSPVTPPFCLPEQPPSHDTPSNRLTAVRLNVLHSFPTIHPRRSLLSGRLLPSPYRPHCAARDRVLLWTSPYIVAMQTQLDSYLPLQSQGELLRQALSRLEPSTREGYGSGLLHFHVMCDCIGVPEDARMPASEALISSFTAQFPGKLTDSAVKNMICGLELWHTINHAPWYGNSHLVRLIKRAVTKAGVALKRPPRPPVLIAHLRALRDSLNLNLARDAAIFALALAAFWGCRRLGELVPDSTKSYDPTRHLPCGTAREHTTFRGLDALTFHIPWTKTTGVAGGSLILTALPDADPLCPLQAYYNHRRLSVGMPRTESFFAYFLNDGSIRRLTKTDIVGAFNAAAAHAGLALILGHSLRIGGSLEYLLEGVEIEIVMQLGGWTSSCFLIYWRRLDLVIPQGVITARARARMDDFARCHPVSQTDSILSSYIQH